MDAAITPDTRSLTRERRTYAVEPLRRVLRSFAAYVQSGSSHSLWTSASAAAQFSLLPAREQDRLLDRGIFKPE